MTDGHQSNITERLPYWLTVC